MNGILDIIRNLKNSASNQYEGDIVEFLIDLIKEGESNDREIQKQQFGEITPLQKPNNPLANLIQNQRKSFGLDEGTPVAPYEMPKKDSTFRAPMKPEEFGRLDNSLNKGVMELLGMSNDDTLAESFRNSFRPNKV